MVQVGCRDTAANHGRLGLILRSSRRSVSSLIVVAVVVPLLSSIRARADEGGVPFWLSGQYASMSALPPTPGWTVTLLPYYYDGSANASKTFPRGDTLVANLDSHASLLNAQLGYVWHSQILGGVPMLGLSWGVGRSDTGAKLAAALPSTNPLTTLSDSVTGGTDLYPIASLSWNEDDDNWMAYLTGDIPVGAYNAQRLSNLGIGHGAIDTGGGYTYLNQQTGFEFSAVAGFTYNWKNPDTNYRNGVDSHVDWAISQFLSDRWQAGFDGYFYYQLSNDSYPTAGTIGRIRQQVLGGFKAHVASVGPEVGYVFKMGQQTAYFNLRGYWEFWAQNRLDGYTLIATINLPLGE